MKTKTTFSQRLLNLLGLSNADWDRKGSRVNDTAVIRFPETSSISKLPQPLNDRYDIKRVLGKGAFGVVFLARDLQIGRLIAVKQLFKKYQEDTEVHSRFLQEARIAGQIDHPNIVTIYNVEIVGPATCIIMEFLGGGNLATLQAEAGTLTEEVALNNLRDILNGLDAAHQMGVVHRDVKPRNILFDQKGVPKISDFGIAHYPAQFGGIDTTGGEDLMPAGTPHYMAPEQMDSRSRVDARADLYSAGTIFYEMLCGRKMYNFKGIRRFSKLAKIVDESDPEPLENLVPDISPTVRELFEKLTHKDPDQRFPDAKSAIIAVDATINEISDVNGRAEANPPVIAPPPRTQKYRQMYEDVLRLFLVDGVLSAAERRELTRRAERLGLSEVEGRGAEERVRQDLGLPLLKHMFEYETRFNDCLDTGGPSNDQRANLNRIATECNIPDPSRRKIEDRVLLKRRIQNGTAFDAPGNSTPGTKGGSKFETIVPQSSKAK